MGLWIPSLKFSTPFTAHPTLLPAFHIHNSLSTTKNHSIFSFPLSLQSKKQTNCFPKTTKAN